MTGCLINGSRKGYVESLAKRLRRMGYDVGEVYYDVFYNLYAARLQISNEEYAELKKKGIV